MAQLRLRYVNEYVDRQGKLRRYFRRNKHGADTPAGHRCSNLIEQLQNLRDATGDQRTHLLAAIQKTMTELSEAKGE